MFKNTHLWNFRNKKINYAQYVNSKISKWRFAFYSTINDFNDTDRHTAETSPGRVWPPSMCSHVSHAVIRFPTEISVSHEINKLFIVDFENGIASRRHLKRIKNMCIMRACVWAVRCMATVVDSFCDIFPIKPRNKRVYMCRNNKLNLEV